MLANWIGRLIIFPTTRRMEKSDENNQDRDERDRSQDSSEEPPQMKLRDLSPEKDPMGASRTPQPAASSVHSLA